MGILEKLSSLGFQNSEVTGESKGVTTIRARTSKGWVYQKFTSETQIDSWANSHEPEVQA